MIDMNASPRLSAIYYGLLLSGYDYFMDGKPQAQARWLSAHRQGQRPVAGAFFAAAAIPGREPYAYWPRAYLMECAVLAPDAPAFRRHVMSCANLTDADRDEAFWAWIEDLPQALETVMQAPGFWDYLVWEKAWLAQCRTVAAPDMARLEDALAALSASPVTVLLCPIKSAWASDYFPLDDRLIVTGGALRPESILHECLHPAVHRALKPWRRRIEAGDWGAGELDASYQLAGGAAGRLNAFEELTVRRLTDSWEQGTTALDITGCIMSLLEG